jgi:hypothetical protein
MPRLKLANREARHLVLIDIENLAATPSPTIQEVRMVTSALRDAVPQYDEAQRVVACSHHAAHTVAFGFPAGRRLWRSGPNGADLALVEVLQNERVDERFGRVTICSGDGIFASSAARLAGANVDVTVVSLEGHLAARLQLAARTVIFLAFPTSIISTGSAS